MNSKNLAIQFGIVNVEAELKFGFVVKIFLLLDIINILLSVVLEIKLAVRNERVQAVDELVLVLVRDERHGKVGDHQGCAQQAVLVVAYERRLGTVDRDLDDASQELN